VGEGGKSAVRFLVFTLNLPLEALRINCLISDGDTGGGGWGICSGGRSDEDLFGGLGESVIIPTGLTSGDTECFDFLELDSRRHRLPRLLDRWGAAGRLTLLVDPSGLDA
jgi:hypothetical protein